MKKCYKNQKKNHRAPNFFLKAVKNSANGFVHGAKGFVHGDVKGLYMF